MIQDTFWTYFSGLLDVDLVWAPNNGPRPAQTFCTIQMTPAQQLPVHHGPVDNEGKRKIASIRAVDVQIQCFGPGSWAVLDTLALKLRTEAALITAEAANIAVMDVVRIQAVPSLVDGAHYEERAILDLACSYVGSIEEYASWIATVIVADSVTEQDPVPEATG